MDLLHALETGQENRVRQLLNRGADANSDLSREGTFTALMYLRSRRERIRR